MTQSSGPKRSDEQPLIETAANTYKVFLKQLQYCIWLNNQIREIISSIEIQWDIKIEQLEDIAHRAYKLNEFELDNLRQMVPIYRSVCETVPAISGHIEWELDFLAYNLGESTPELYQKYQQSLEAYRASSGRRTKKPSPDSRKLDSALKKVEESFEEAERVKNLHFRWGLNLLGEERAVEYLHYLQLKRNIVYVNLQADATMTNGISRVYSVALPIGISYAAFPVDAIIPLRSSDKQIRVATVDLQGTKKRYTRLSVKVSTETGDFEGMNPKLQFVTPTRCYLIFDQPLAGKMVTCSFLT